MKSYLGNSLHLLSSMTQPAMTAFTLRRLRASAAFLGPFNHLAKKLMRQGIKLFGSEEAGPRLQVGAWLVCVGLCVGCVCRVTPFVARSVYQRGGGGDGWLCLIPMQECVDTCTCFQTTHCTLLGKLH